VTAGVINVSLLTFSLLSKVEGVELVECSLFVVRLP
jgi:hypothetical protein